MIISETYKKVDILTWYDLTQEEKDDQMNYSLVKESSFFRFINEVWDVSDFMRLSIKNKYYGVLNLSAFHGILIYPTEDNQLIVYTYIS